METLPLFTTSFINVPPPPPLSLPRLSATASPIPRYIASIPISLPPPPFFFRLFETRLRRNRGWQLACLVRESRLRANRIWIARVFRILAALSFHSVVGKRSWWFQVSRAEDKWRQSTGSAAHFVPDTAANKRPIALRGGCRGWGELPTPSRPTVGKPH